MRFLPATAVLLVVAAACVAEPTTGESVTPTSTTTSSTPTTTTTTSVTTTFTFPPGDPVAVVAPSGVPVAVTAIRGDTFQVLTPCGDAATLRGGIPIYEVDVVIDPGHGGPIDTGAVSPGGLPEKEINLRVAGAVYQILSGRGIATILTRTGDYPVPISTRAAYADMLGAEVLVSIHHNAPTAPASDTPGVEVFVQSGSSDSTRLGGLLYEASMAALGQFDVDWDRASDAGVMTVLNPRGLDAYGMIRRPETVSALIELGYIANSVEAELYSTPQYVPAVATSLADAIEAYLTTNNQGSGFVDGRVFTPGSSVGKDQCIEPNLELSLYPDVIGADVVAEGLDMFGFAVTLSSPYDSAERYADAFRVVGDDGRVYGIQELTHDHATEQPFTRMLSGVQIPAYVSTVTIEGRDQTYGWGGQTLVIDLP